MSGTESPRRDFKSGVETVGHGRRPERYLRLLQTAERVPLFCWSQGAVRVNSQIQLSAGRTVSPLTGPDTQNLEDESKDCLILAFLSSSQDFFRQEMAQGSVDGEGGKLRAHVRYITQSLLKQPACSGGFASVWLSDCIVRSR